ncbi:hypothetical protein [Treponema sp.]|uniref:hypothetical protein n=1 Tax=Treponema sp. TaxID=166 RepID=UPI0025EE2D8D|nr:hypothetical protein [Treponema sp.]MCR5218386.1 hypothetical protein [Treponema sp.]
MAANIIEAMEKFSRKMESFKKSDDKKNPLPESADQKLQKRINLTEEERLAAIKNEYENFKNPLSREIESDEEALLKAYELFTALNELKKSFEGQGASLKSCQIDCSLCHKSEYTKPACSKFIFLQCWLYFEKNIRDYIPVIEENKNGSHDIAFADAEDFHFYSREKEIWESIAALY